MNRRGFIGGLAKLLAAGALAAHAKLGSLVPIPEAVKGPEFDELLAPGLVPPTFSVNTAYWFGVEEHWSNQAYALWAIHPDGSRTKLSEMPNPFGRIPWVKISYNEGFVRSMAKES